jgi:chromosome segregation ATPase
VKKYHNSWLSDNKLSLSEVDDDEDDLSEEYLAAFKKEIKRKKAKAHKELYDRLSEMDGTNDVLAAENDNLRRKIESIQSEADDLRQSLGYYKAQFESQAEEITSLTGDLQRTQDVAQQHQTSAEGAVQRERETADKLTEALVRETHLQSRLESLEQSSKASEILSAALQREQWFEDIGKTQFAIIQKLPSAGPAAKAVQKGGSQRQTVT